MQDQAEKLRSLVRSIAPKIPPHNARRISFLSGKGGVGKTSLAVNIALALARMGHKTILIDCDLGLANADVLLGVQPRLTLDRLLTSDSEVRRALVNLPSGLWLLPGAGQIVPRDAVDTGRLEHVLESLDDSAEFILMDGGAGIDEGVQHVAGLSDEIAIIVSPESTSTLNAYRLIKVLVDRNPRLTVRLIINKVLNDFAARRAAGRLTNAVRKFLDTDPEFVGWVPTDPIVEQSAIERRPFVERYPASLPSRAVVTLALRLLQLPPEPPRAA